MVEHVLGENAILERNGKPLINIAKVTIVVQLLVKMSSRAVEQRHLNHILCTIQQT